MPLTPRPDRSVLSDVLDRVVSTNIVYDYGEPTQSLEIVWADGSIFRSGSASVNDFPNSKSRGANPSGPGLDFYRFMQGAQGTMGIVTWMSLKIEHKTKIDKIYFAPVSDLTYANNFLHRIMPRRIGQEILLLNNVDLAAILAEKVEDFDTLCSKLPAWTLILTMSGHLRRPEEKIAYEEKFLKETLYNEYPSLELTEKLPGFPGIGFQMMPLLRQAWPADVKYWKNRLRGGVQDIFYITRPGKVAEQIKIMDSIAAKNGYAIGDIGKYIQPIEHNRAAQVEFSLFYNPEDEQEKAVVAKINREASLALMDAGAFFSRPYGEIASVVYDRAANYTMALKRTKKVFDPKNIMNPGTLCF
jgi:ribosomal protein S16